MTSVRYRVVLAPGDSFDMPQAERIRREVRLASLFDARTVSISPDPLSKRRGTITVRYGPSKAKIDWLNDVGPWPGPTGGIDKPIPIGRDEGGNIVSVTMLYNNLLIGGIPGAGKSVAMGMVMAAAALDPTCEVWTIDGGGGVEMKVWRRRASRQAITEQDAFLLVQDLKHEVDARLELLMESDRQKIEPGEATILLGIEELATYTAKEKKRDEETGFVVKPSDPGETFTEALTYVVRLGRKVGVMVAANTQRPSAAVVDPNLRDLLGTGLALYCKTGTSSDTILGEGWRGQGYNAAKLPRNRKGSFVLSPETDTPTRGRCFLVTGDELREIAERCVPADTDDFLSTGQDDDDADSRLEEEENAVLTLSERPVSTPADDTVLTGLRIGANDLEAMRRALDPVERRALIQAVWAGSTYGNRRLAKLEAAGYFSVPPRTDATAPKQIITTLAGRDLLKQAESQR
jgi:hypothetical protein